LVFFLLSFSLLFPIIHACVSDYRLTTAQEFAKAHFPSTPMIDFALEVCF
jgi:hypothetical protein